MGVRPVRNPAGLFVPLVLATLCAAATALAAPAVPETAFAEGIIRDGDPKVEVRLLVDREAVYAGVSARVGVLFSLQPGWHVYWRNPGQSGLATLVEWDIDGAEPGSLAWPAPEVFAESDGFLTTYGYSREVLLFTTVRFADDLGDEVEVAVDVDYLACEIQCVPGRAELGLTLAVREADVPASDEILELFDTYEARVPQNAEELGFQVEGLYSQTAIRPGDEFDGAIALIAPEGVRMRPHSGPGAFVPDQIPSLELGVSGSVPHPLDPRGMLVQFTGRAGERDPGEDQRLTGLVALRGRTSPESWVEIDVAIPRAASGAEIGRIENPWLAPAPPKGPSVPIWRAVLFALLGGLILNLMPCVLPVLAIKVVGLTEFAHLSRRELFGHGLAYTSGILFTMLALAASVVGLRLAGTQVGWGFQFQEPLFVAAISTVLLLFALNLFGVFEILVNSGALTRIEEQATGKRRSFFEGLLAVVVATPCSAPFLGTAIGFAFASSTPVIIGIFLAIGLGLASPYLLVTMVPAWARWIPRAGGWMLHLRAALGFALLGSVVWLLWLEGRYGGVDGMVGLLVFLLVVGFAAWVFGALQRAASTRTLAAIVVLGALVLLAGGITLPIGGDGEDTSVSEAIAWQEYDPGEIAASVRGGRVVFVDFTADWCITCKLNERVVLSNERVIAELERLNVVSFKADWTRRDSGIQAELARRGRAGVPMYLVFRPGVPDDPAVLPELLTVDGFIQALRSASESRYVSSPDVRDPATAASDGLGSRL